MTHPEAIEWHDMAVIGGEISRNTAGQLYLRLHLAGDDDATEYTLAGVIDDAAALAFLPRPPAFVVTRIEEP